MDLQESPTTPNLDPPKTPWLKRFLIACVNVFWKPVETRLGALVLAGALVLGGGLKIMNVIEDNDRAARERDALALAEDDYRIALTLWQREVEEFDKCLDDAVVSKERVDQLRDVLLSIVDLTVLFPESEDAALFTAAKTAEIETKYPPINLAERQAACIEPGVKPVDPTP